MSKLRQIIRALYSPKYLIYTNTITGAVFLGSGDCIEQFIENNIIDKKEVKEYDTRRIGSMVLTGTYFGFAGHLWYNLLDSKFSGITKRMIAKKLFCEMVIGPPFAATVFFIVGKLEGKSISKSWDGLKDNFLYLCLADWCFYVPLQAINFYCLAPRFRFLYVAAISLVYDTFLSFVLHRNEVNTNTEVKSISQS